MPDFITLGIGFAGVVAIPLGAVIKKSYNNEARLTALETKEKNTSEAVIRIELKLDRLIEKFL